MGRNGPDGDKTELLLDRKEKIGQVIENIAGIIEMVKKAEDKATEVPDKKVTKVPDEKINPKMSADDAVKELKSKMLTFIQVLRESIMYTEEEGLEALSVSIQKVTFVIDQQIMACDTLAGMTTENDEPEEAEVQDGNPGSARIDEALAVQPAPKAAQDMPVVLAVLIQPPSEAAQDMPVGSAALLQPAPKAVQVVSFSEVEPAKDVQVHVPKVVLPGQGLPEEGSVPDWRESGPALPPVPKEKVFNFDEAKALQEKRRAQETKVVQKKPRAQEAFQQKAPPAPIQAEKTPVNEGKKRAFSDMQADLVAPVQAEEALKKRDLGHIQTDLAVHFEVQPSDQAGPVDAEQGMPGPALPADQAVPGNADQVAPSVAQDMVIDLTSSD
jgi:hypothetical protein